ncbi:hypothetical protein AB0M29_05265 [Streptomyces sp. NPDC051976]|uniref:hypothetical protein n=1 Tax=Streptomyces sp. NPDC051976 TaxID=3154947 RepID=UPI003413EC3A
MRLFIAGRFCVSVEDLDFLNPNKLEDGRECGSRLELRLVRPDTEPGSIYVSRALAVDRAVCRFDLLETAPHAQDRMHWHPHMPGGEGRKRSLDPELSSDPLGWLGRQLRDAVSLLGPAGVPEPEQYAPDALALAAIADEIVEAAAASLARTRRPWQPVAARDERGMAVAG